MLIDKRTYTYHPSQFGTFLKFYATLGFPLTTKHLGTTLGIFTSASGVANQTVQLFAYEDHDHRDACRARLLNDPAWLDFVRVAGPYIRQQENMIITPTAGSALRDLDGVNAVREAAAERIASNGRALIFEWAEFACIPGGSPAALKLIESDGTNAFDRHLGAPVGRFEAETGDLDRFFILLGYTTLADRDVRFRALRADSTYAEFMERLAPLLIRRETTLLAPTAYSPLR